MSNEEAVNSPFFIPIFQAGFDACLDAVRQKLEEFDQGVDTGKYSLLEYDALCRNYLREMAGPRLAEKSKESGG